MTAGARYGLGVALTAIGLVLASAGLVSLIDGGGRSGEVPPIALDETASDTGDPAGGDEADAPADSGDGSGDASTRDRGGVAIGPAGPASGDAGDTTTTGDAAPTDDAPRTTARARSTSDRGTAPDPVTPTAEPVQVPVDAAGTPDATDVSPDDAPTADADPPAPSPDDTPTTDAPGPGGPTPAPAPTVDETPVDEPVRAPTSADCDRGPDWPWAERAGSQGRGDGHGPPVGGCHGRSAVGAVATVLAAPTPLGVHVLVRMIFG